MVKAETARKFTFDVAWVFFASTAAMIFGLVIRIFLGNFFDASGLGAYAMVLTIWGIVTLTTGAGAPGALIKYVSECPEDRDTCNSLVSASILNSFFLGLAATIIFVVAAPWLESIFNIPDLGNLLRIASISFPFVTMNNVFVSYLNAVRKMKLYAAFEIYRKGIVVIFTIIFIWMGLGIPGAVWALVVAPISVTIAQEAYHRKLFMYTFKRYRENTKKLFNFGVRIFVASILGTINWSTPTFLIGFYLLDADVGVFAVAFMFLNLFLMLPGSIQRITFPMLSQYYFKYNYISMKKAIETVVHVTFVLLAILSIFLFFFIDDMISLLFPGKIVFLEAVFLIKMITILGVPYCTISSIEHFFISIGKPNIALYISAVRLGLTFVIGIILVPLNYHVLGIQIGGLNGAAISFGTSLIISAFIYLFIMKRHIPIPLNLNSFYGGFGLFLFFIALSLIITNLLPGFENLIGILISIFLTMILYILIVLPLGGLKSLLAIKR